MGVSFAQSNEYRDFARTECGSLFPSLGAGRSDLDGNNSQRRYIIATEEAPHE
jgi:hypothetical protein